MLLTEMSNAHLSEQHAAVALATACHVTQCHTALCYMASSTATLAYHDGTYVPSWYAVLLDVAGSSSSMTTGWYSI